MGENGNPGTQRGKWMALTAALLGWMFDGLEQGLFSLVGNPALGDLLGTTDKGEIGRWFGVITASFLVGAATGGVLFGWLGDRIGRVRAMTLSILTYALFSGLCAFVTAPWQMTGLRFCSALGMGGEWSLGVALVVEIWPDRSRALLAGLIGAAANVGYLLLALLGLWLSNFLGDMRTWLLAVGLPTQTVETLVAHQGWRLLMMAGALPALLTFLIRIFVPESERWQREEGRGTTSHWATRDLGGVLIGALAACGIIYLWAEDFSLAVRVVGSLGGLVVVTLGYLYPVIRYLRRARAADPTSGRAAGPTVRRMLLGACLSGVALLGTWASLQWASKWADDLTGGKLPEAKAYTQLWSAVGAIIGTIVGALMGNWFGRRLAYSLLCLGALASSLIFFQLNDGYGVTFLATVCLAGGLTASFYGWLPLYLPELFPTGVRATGQGFSYNFGRILAAVGALQTGNLIDMFKGNLPYACSLMSLIYVVGVVIIWLAPETRGKPLPE